MCIPWAICGLIPYGGTIYPIANTIVLPVANICSCYFGAVLSFAVAPDHKLKSAQSLVLAFAISTVGNLWHSIAQDSNKDLPQYVLAVAAEIALVFLMSKFLNPEKILNFVEVLCSTSESKFGLKIIISEVLLGFVGTFIRLCQWKTGDCRIALPGAGLFFWGVIVIAWLTWRKLSVRYRVAIVTLCAACVMQVPELFDRIAKCFS